MTTEEVKLLLKHYGKPWDGFLKFMTGQTVGMGEDGEADWYESDVDRYIKRNGEYGNPEEWD